MLVLLDDVLASLDRGSARHVVTHALLGTRVEPGAPTAGLQEGQGGVLRLRLGGAGEAGGAGRRDGVSEGGGGGGGGCTVVLVTNDVRWDPEQLGRQQRGKCI